MTLACPPALRTLYKAGRLIPFVGAGISMGVNWTTDQGPRRGPSWAELVDEAARQLGFQKPQLARVRGTDLQILEYYRARNQTMAGLTNWLLTDFHPPDDALAASPIHRELALLDLCSLVYTTNFDDYLERAFKLEGREHRRVAREAHMGVAPQPPCCEIVKFHGDLSDPEYMVLSESDYEERLRLDSAMDYRLRGDILGRALLFLGYSFSDWNVAYLFRTVNDAFGALPESLTGRRAYIAVADPSDFESRLFASRNIEVIPLRGDRRADDIAMLLQQLRGD